MTETKRCGGYRGKWACEEDYPDHMVPLEEFTKSGLGLKNLCKSCTREEHYLSNPINNPKNNPRSNAVSAIAYSMAGGSGNFYALTKENRLSLRAEAAKEYEPVEKFVKIKTELPKIQKDPKTKSISVPRETYPKEGYVYIFQDMMKPNGVYKIGSTDDVGGRLSNARTWGEFRCVRWFYSDDCKLLEKNAHSALSEFKIKKDGMGDEWFQIAKDAAINKIQELSNAATAI